MLLKLPIMHMLWSNAPEFCLLCSNYAPYVRQYAPHAQIQNFLSLNLQNHEYQQSLFIYLFSEYWHFVFLVIRFLYNQHTFESLFVAFANLA